MPGAPGVTFEKVNFDEANLLVPFRIALVLLDAVLEAFGKRTEADPVLLLDTPGMTDS